MPTDIPREQMVEWVKEKISDDVVWLQYAGRAGLASEKVDKEIEMFQAILTALEERVSCRRCGKETPFFTYDGDPICADCIDKLQDEKEKGEG